MRSISSTVSLVSGRLPTMTFGFLPSLAAATALRKRARSSRYRPYTWWASASATRMRCAAVRNWLTKRSTWAGLILRPHMALSRFWRVVSCSRVARWRSLSARFLSRSFSLRLSTRRASFSITLSLSATFSLCVASSCSSCSGSSVSSAMSSRTRIWSASRRPRQAMTSASTQGSWEMMSRTVLRPSSMRLAISTSPSRVSSGTVPISRRYMRTGSSVLPMAPGVRSSSGPSSSVAASSFSPRRRRRRKCAASEESISSMSSSPNMTTMLSIWSPLITSGGSMSLTSS